MWTCENVRRHCVRVRASMYGAPDEVRQSFFADQCSKQTELTKCAHRTQEKDNSSSDSRVMDGLEVVENKNRSLHSHQRDRG